MPKAEVGSTKHLANKLKSKGLQRLRWYCQVCEKQCRDANGFKMHTQSESHVRQMLVVGEDPKKFINQFSEDFLRDFLQLLKTGHGEKQVQMNHFYQEYIANKEHIHMNATRWPSLTEFAKYLGKEGICRVEETEKGIHISWIDNSPDALRRQEALRRKEAQDQGDEQLEQRMIREQIRRAQQQASASVGASEAKEEERELRRQDGDEKITLSFGSKKATKNGIGTTVEVVGGEEGKTPSLDASASVVAGETTQGNGATESKPASLGGGVVSMKIGAKPQTKNVFAQAKKNALAGSRSKKPSKIEQPQKMSEAERIMRDEMDRKRSRESAGFGFNMSSGKKQRNS
ncbi:hypothetical protein E4U36_003007 [Claviceps purpurea]|nr:hypothetical protein E4U36_003007 [Claviceps purpurea]